MILITTTVAQDAEGISCEMRFASPDGGTPEEERLVKALLFAMRDANEKFNPGFASLEVNKIEIDLPKGFGEG